MKRQLFIWLSSVTLVMILLAYGSAQEKVTVQKRTARVKASALRQFRREAVV